MSVASLYQQIVLDHHHAPRHRGSLAGATHEADGHNPLCGDHVRIEVLMDGDVLRDIVFSGESCAITTATASMMSERVIGLCRADIENLFARFAVSLHALPDTPTDEYLGDMNALNELRRYPARLKCALLPWATLQAALGRLVSTSTETSGKINTVNDTLNFRNAVTADVEAIVALVESAYRGDSSRQGWTTEANMLDGQRTDAADVARLIAHGHSRVLLLTRSTGELRACAHIERQGEICYFGMFSVNPTEQGGGIGRAMLGEGERIARGEWRCREMQMTVISIRDELIAWYERRGYQRSGIYKPFPYGDVRFGLPKRDDLRFEILRKNLG